MTEQEIIELAKQAGAGFLADTIIVNGKDAHDFVVRLAGLVSNAERESCAECVPSNWCDPMLSGPNSVVGNVPDCRQIEAILRAVKARITRRSIAS